MKHILIMEDNLPLAHQWTDAFELNGHRVTLTHNGDDAVASLQQTTFDLVITDLFVPNANGGFHVFGEILFMDNNAPPVIAVTDARPQKADTDGTNYFLKQAERLGATKTLEKPFASAELLAIANDIWARRA